MEIRELFSEAEMQRNYPLIQQLYPEVTQADYEAMLGRFIALGYRQAGLFDQDHCIGLIGFQHTMHFTCGDYIYIDDLVIDEHHRSLGYATKLLDWVENEAENLGCKVILLDCFVENKQPQRLYHRQGYSILAYHFGKTKKT